MGAYPEAARRRVHLATVLLRPPSGHHSGRRQARHAHIIQIGLHPPDATMKPVDTPRYGPVPRISMPTQA